jgi:hypothetical protein
MLSHAQRYLEYHGHPRLACAEACWRWAWASPTGSLDPTCGPSDALKHRGRMCKTMQWIACNPVFCGRLPWEVFTLGTSMSGELILEGDSSCPTVR